MNSTYLNLRKSDLFRYDGKSSDITRMLKYFRKCQTTSNPLLLILWRYLFKREKDKRAIEIYGKSNIGHGLYLGHAFGITINSEVVVGSNCNIHKGVTIGQENRV